MERSPAEATCPAMSWKRNCCNVVEDAWPFRAASGTFIDRALAPVNSSGEMVKATTGAKALGVSKA